MFKIGQLVLSSELRQFIPVKVVDIRLQHRPCCECGHKDFFVTIETLDGRQQRVVEDWQLQEIDGQVCQQLYAKLNKRWLTGF